LGFLAAKSTTAVLIGKTQPMDISLAHLGLPSLVTEANQKTTDLLASLEVKSLPDGPTIMAISLGNNDAGGSACRRYRRCELLDKIYLVEELIPAIPRLAPASSLL